MHHTIGKAGHCYQGNILGLPVFEGAAPGCDRALRRAVQWLYPNGRLRDKKLLQSGTMDKVTELHSGDYLNQNNGKVHNSLRWDCVEVPRPLALFKRTSLISESANHSASLHGPLCGGMHSIEIYSKSGETVGLNIVDG